MAKQKKKRNKKYTGAGAAQTHSEVVRVTAVKRNKFQLWWLEKKPIAKPVSIAVGIGGAIILVLYGLVGLFF